MPVMRLIILLVAAGAAVAAAFLVRGLQNQQPAVAPIQTIERVERTARKEEPKLNVLVAAADLRVGQYVTPEMLVWQSWPMDSNTTAFFTDANEPNALEELTGSVVRFDMLAGEPLTIQKVVHAGQGGFMSAVLTPGMRAVAVEINSETAAGGFVFPNDRVDVVLTYDVQVLQGEGVVNELAIDTILYNTRVLAIDGYYRPIAGEEGNAIVGNRATLELSKEDALVLTAAKKKGDLSFVLRSISEADGPTGSTPRSRQLAGRKGGSIEGIRVFEFGNAGMLVNSVSGRVRAPDAPDTQEPDPEYPNDGA